MNTEQDIGSQICAIVLEHTWRTALQRTQHLQCTTPNPQAGNDPVITLEDVRKLLDFTRAVLIQKISTTGGWDGGMGGSGVSNPGDQRGYDESRGYQEIGRGFLKLYLALEIAKPGSRLVARYLNDGTGQGAAHAPAELQWTFVQNLARFMLSVAAIIEKDSDIRTMATESMPPVVSAEEAVDSLFYLIDRYVHVELEVPEEFNIKGHLWPQHEAEIHHYFRHPRYRDHLLHVIDVFLLGHLLLKTEIHIHDGHSKPLLGVIAEIKVAGEEKLLEAEWLRNWALTGLFHDIGYQLGHGKSLTPELAEWARYFSLSPTANSPFAYPENEGDDVASKDLKRCLDATRRLSEEIYKCADLNGFFIVPSDRHLKDHGVLSAIRLAQLLAHFDEENKSYPHDESFARHYRHAVQAIFHHNCPDKNLIKFGEHPMACLLRICDELQEWERRRVNLAKFLKGLYLDLQQARTPEPFPSYELFDSFQANINIEPVPGQDGLPVAIKTVLSHDDFRFRLNYHDALEDEWDPIAVLLSKTYNLQHLDLSLPGGRGSLALRIELHFPIPARYYGTTEYDIYSLFTDKARALPLLRAYDSIDDAGPGLAIIRSRNNEPEKITKEDVFGLVLKGEPAEFIGRLHSNPDYYFHDFNEFKKEILAGKKKAGSPA